MNPPFEKPNYTARTLGDRCIVSCGTEPHYFEQLHATKEYCTKYAPEAWQLFYYGYPDGCPPQSQHQYAFKIKALERAFDAGFASVLWLDTAFQPIASLAPLWKEVDEHGWYIQGQGDALLGNWCSDIALHTFGITRDVAMGIQLCYSGMVALKLNHTIGEEIFKRWVKSYYAGTFDGPHLNDPLSPTRPWGQKLAGHCSTDPRCQGHRHDESALSFILWEMGLTPRHEPFLTLSDDNGFIGHHRKLLCP